MIFLFFTREKIFYQHFFWEVIINIQHGLHFVVFNILGIKYNYKRKPL